MPVLYFGLYLLAFMMFMLAAFYGLRRLERGNIWLLVPCGLAAWVLVSVFKAGLALGN